MTVKEIEATMAEVINSHLSTNVEVTHRGTGLYTISGNPQDVDQAVKFLNTHKMMVEQSREYDSELEESFSYMTEI